MAVEDRARHAHILRADRLRSAARTGRTCTGVCPGRAREYNEQACSKDGQLIQQRRAHLMAFSGLSGTWGTISWHGHHFSGRQLVAWAGAAFWLLVMIVSYGTGGIVALWTALVFMVALIVLTSATRTVSIRQVTSLFLLGGFTMGLVYVVAQFIPHTPLRAFMVPPMEETFKIAPVLFVLWRGRNSTTWTLGVTDVMLLAAASGVGFGMVADAYIRHTRG